MKNKKPEEGMKGEAYSYMFKIGDYVVNGVSGICVIDAIDMMKVGGVEREYYFLTPVNKSNAKLYIPTDIARERIRLVMSKKQALNLIYRIDTYEEMQKVNEKELESHYKKAIASCDPEKLIGVIKLIYYRKLEKEAAKRKLSVIDEKYFKLAEKQLYEELSFVLQIEKEQVVDLIEKSVSQSKYKCIK